MSCNCKGCGRSRGEGYAEGYTDGYKKGQEDALASKGEETA